MNPVRCLQSIFKKREPQVRRPSVNYIAEKYKNRAPNSTKSRKGSRTTATANQLASSNAPNSINLNIDDRVVISERYAAVG